MSQPPPVPPSPSARPARNWRANLALLCSLLALVVALSPEAGAAARRLLTGRDIRDGSIQSRDIANGANGVSSADLANGAVSSAKLADGAATQAKIAAGAVGSGQLADGAATQAKIAAGAVGSSQLADGSVGRAQLAADALGSQLLVSAPGGCYAYEGGEIAVATSWTASGVYATSGSLVCPLTMVPAHARITSVELLIADTNAGSDSTAIFARYDETSFPNAILETYLTAASTSGTGVQRVTLTPPPAIVDGDNFYSLYVGVSASLKLQNFRVHYTLEPPGADPAARTGARSAERHGAPAGPTAGR